MTNALQAVSVSKHFGGVSAVSDVSLSLGHGQVHGLIGPNGSGKTTLLNLLSGFYPADGGSIQFAGNDISSMAVQKRAESGIGRTFQKPRLLDSLSVLDNVMLGAWRDYTPSFFDAMLATPRLRRDERRIRDRARALLDALGLAAFEAQPAEALGHAEQKFTEIARGLIHNPHFILLDEPAGGLTEQEINRLGEIIKAIAASDIGVLVVEHHTEFVFEISDAVTTLSLGKVIAAGDAKSVASDSEVIRVYLGNG